MKKKSHVEPISHNLYIIVRNDLPSLNAGKAMAHAAHAANHFTTKWGHLEIVQEWLETGDGFGTTIALAADKDTITKRIQRAAMYDGSVPFGPVWDKTYPFITTTEIAALIPKRTLTAEPIFKDDGKVVLFRRELTAGYLFVVEGSQAQLDLTGDLPLHP